MQFEGRLQSKESILCWNQVPQAKQSTVVGLRDRKFDDNNGNEDRDVIPCTLSYNTLRNRVDASNSAQGSNSRRGSIVICQTL